MKSNLRIGDVMKNKQTAKLLDVLNNFKDKSQLDKYVDLLASKDSSLILSEYILKVAKDKGIKKSEIIKNSYIYRTYGYEILSGKKLPSRDKLLQICIGNKFTLDETNRSLTLAKLGILYAKDPRDSIIIYTLNNGLSLININIILDEHNFKPLI